MTIGAKSLRKDLAGRLARWRRPLQMLVDALAWAVAIVAATALRYDLVIGDGWLAGLLAFIVLAVVFEAMVGLGVGLYAGRWRFGSFDEVLALVGSTVATTTGLVVVDLLIVPRPVPLGVALGAGAGALVITAGVRYLWRLSLERCRRPQGTAEGRILVFGAGDGGAQVVTALLRDPSSPYLPVGLLDDDPGKRNLRIMGVRVLGGRAQLGAVAAERQADILLIAIPSAGAELVGELDALATAAGLRVKVVPPVRELYGDRISPADIRDLSVEDLLGRRQVDTDLASIAGYLTGKRVLVTGAGGSIGSELCRQIYHFAPAELVMLDRDESALHAVQLSIEGRALLDSPGLVLADIRDRQAIEEVFASHRPEVVFHAAALKHLTLLERHPDEACKSNLWGTSHVLSAAAAGGVQRFVNISTDKAAAPTSVLGYSKRVAERLTAGMAAEAPGTFLSVRFGNVLGSRGSVLGTFRAQVEAGGPITVTDPEVTRYFMTVPEAVQLTIQAAAIGRGGEALVLDMGQPVRIADVARRLADEAARPIQIVFTGLRPGEKCHEVLFGPGEADLRPVHPLISHVAVPPLSDQEAEVALARAGLDVAGGLRWLCEAGSLAYEA